MAAKLERLGAAGGAVLCLDSGRGACASQARHDEPLDETERAIAARLLDEVGLDVSSLEASTAAALAGLTRLR
jgi:hypothetical protein